MLRRRLKKFVCLFGIFAHYGIQGIVSAPKARLCKGLKMQRQLGSPKHSPAFPCPLLYPCQSESSVVPSPYPLKRFYQPLLHRETRTPAQVFAQGFTIDIQRRGQLTQCTEAREAPQCFENAFREREKPGRVAGGE